MEPTGHWTELCEQISKEYNPKKFTELVNQLLRALEEHKELQNQTKQRFHDST